LSRTHVDVGRLIQHMGEAGRIEMLRQHGQVYTRTPHGPSPQCNYQRLLLYAIYILDEAQPSSVGISTHISGPSSRDDVNYGESPRVCPDTCHGRHKLCFTRCCTIEGIHSLLRLWQGLPHLVLADNSAVDKRNLAPLSLLHPLQEVIWSILQVA